MVGVWPAGDSLRVVSQTKGVRTESVRGVALESLRAGQTWQAGDAILELTKIRVPCSQLDAYGLALRKQIFDTRVKQGDTTSPLWARSGFYASVRRGGRVSPGAPFELLSEVA